MTATSWGKRGSRGIKIERVYDLEKLQSLTPWPILEPSVKIMECWWVNECVWTHAQSSEGRWLDLVIDDSKVNENWVCDGSHRGVWQHSLQRDIQLHTNSVKDQYSYLWEMSPNIGVRAKAEHLIRSRRREKAITSLKRRNRKISWLFWYKNMFTKYCNL